MRSTPRLLAEHSSLSDQDQRWLIGLVQEWHLLADTSFSDLILWVPDRWDENVFWAVAQIRPNTGPTALEDDVLGESINYEPEHLVTEAYLAHETCETSDNQLRAGIPVDVWAIPVMRHGRCIGVVERHTNQMGVRAPGALEDCYLEVADILSDMVHNGEFPAAQAQDISISPKVGDGVLRVSPTGMITYASPNAVSAYRRLGVASDVAGEDFRTVTESLLDHVAPVGQTVTADLTGPAPVELDIENPRGVIRMRVIPLTGMQGSEGLLVLCRDTTELRLRDRQLVTKDATIREIHHRVKNNLQTVAALLRLQSRRMRSQEAKDALRDAMARVQSIAVVHELLSQSFDEEVAFDDVADRILRMVGDVAASSGRVSAVREGSFAMVPAGVATSMSLALAELCQNAVEHGLGSGSGRVVVRPVRTASRLIVDVLDNGTGLPEDLDLHVGASLGLSIVRTLVSDMGGSFELSNRADATSGTRARVSVPMDLPLHTLAQRGAGEPEDPGD